MIYKLLHLQNLLIGFILIVLLPLIFLVLKNSEIAHTEIRLCFHRNPAERIDMKTILIVEDDEFIAAIMADMLSMEGYTIHVRKDGTEAIDFIKNNDFDLVILDLMIPGSSSEEVLQAVRTKKYTPVLVCSADSQIERKANAMKADGFIKKPFDVDEFLETIKKYLNNS